MGLIASGFRFIGCFLLALRSGSLFQSCALRRFGGRVGSLTLFLCSPFFLLRVLSFLFRLLLSSFRCDAMCFGILSGCLFCREARTRLLGQVPRKCFVLFGLRKRVDRYAGRNYRKQRDQN